MKYKIVPKAGYFELYINGVFYDYGNTWEDVSNKVDRARDNNKM